MEKIRVYELAKELNTTSKRLMEKLAEINIDVKNHMSLLEEDQLEKLYNHIGLRRKTNDAESSQDAAQDRAKPAVESQRSGVRDIPHIIRKTRIVIDTKQDKTEPPTHTPGKDSYKSNVVSTGSSGLRPGFVYDAQRRDIIANSAAEKKPQHTLDKKEQSIEKKQQIVKKTVQAINKTEAKSVPKQQEKGQKTAKVVEPRNVDSERAVEGKTKPLEKHDEATRRKSVSKMQSEHHVSVKQYDQTQVKHSDKTDTFKSGGPTEKSVVRKDAKPANKDRNVNMPVKKIDGDYSKNSYKKSYVENIDTNIGTKDIRPHRTKPENNIDDTGNKLKDGAKKFSPNKNDKYNGSRLAVIKRSVSGVMADDLHIDEEYDRFGTQRPKKVKAIKQQEKHIPTKAVLTHVIIPEEVTVKELSETLKKTTSDVIKKLISYGIMATINQSVDYDVASMIAEEYGITVEKQVVVSEEDILFDDSEDKPEYLVPRPPVVVVMGHVDHGKTSLLDAIRKTNVIQQEMGGITQHIGAYTVKINNRQITFLDTPGHEAFTAMRARGAQVTDIAILVVAADDGVMPQTIEAINHAKAANVSIIVAINKIDKPDANPEKIKQDLTEYGLVSEEWGGDTIFVPVSAKKMQNIDNLLEMIVLVADVLELKANPNRQAKGTVIEARLDKNKGPIATVLVQRGTLKIGDSIVTGTTVGRIRAMSDDKGNAAKSAGPSTPVEVFGFPEVPEAGEIFYAITDEKVAKQLAEKRRLKQRQQNLTADAKISLDDLFNQIQQGKVKELNIIVKADVQGSVEAVEQALEKLSNENVRIKIIHGGVGAITESDVKLAEVSNAIITGFNVRPAQNVTEIANNLHVDMRLYRVIYNAIEDIEAAMKGMLEPKLKEAVLGHAEVRQVFKITGAGTVGGCYVTDGKISRNNEIRIVRDGIVVHEGKLSSLKRFKDDVKEVAQGFECGIAIERFNDIKEADVIEAFEMQEVRN